MKRFEDWFRAHQAKLWLATLVALIALGLLAAAPRPGAPRWEYRVLSFRPSESETAKGVAEMNKLGNAGWRYAGMVTQRYSGVIVALERQK